jgi:hypothetical protein
MSNDKNKIQFMNYISTPLSDDSITILYTTNNVKFDRVKLYFDFVISFFELLFDTYMGDDITNETEQKNHFNWCWEKNISNFKKEDIFFEDNKDLRSYFYDFTKEIFYNLDGKENNPHVKNNIITLWTHLFNYGGRKTRADLDSFVELYSIFDKSLKNL